MKCKEIGFEDVIWINLAQDMASEEVNLRSTLIKSLEWNLWDDVYEIGTMCVKCVAH
jgi:hypothetical protein